jgi:L-lactate utilization protein LutB
LHNNILAEKDQNVAAELRRKSVTADIFVTSVTAIAETGEITAVDLTGSRVGAFNFAAGQLVVVAGAQKIVPTIADAHTRETEYCLPLESARVRVAYGVPASKINNSVTITGANPWGAPGRVQVIIVKEVLGF